MKNIHRLSQTKGKRYCRRFMGRIAIILAVFWVLGFGIDQKAFSQNKPTIKAGENILSIKSGDQTRKFLLYIPVGYDEKKPLPLVLLFHGAGGNPKAILEFTGLANVAGKKTFIIAAPEGKYPFRGKNAWNFLLDPGGVNDVEFVKDLIKSLSVNK